MSAKLVRVALVDDDASVRRAMSRLLAAYGMEVETYASAGEFSESLERRSPDCVVLDLQMPDETGLELQNRLIRDGIRLPTVFVTAHDEPNARSRCLVAGASAYLTKPLVAKILVAAINDAVSEGPAR